MLMENVNIDAMYGLNVLRRLSSRSWAFETIRDGARICPSPPAGRVLRRRLVASQPLLKKTIIPLSKCCWIFNRRYSLHPIISLKRIYQRLAGSKSRLFLLMHEKIFYMLKCTDASRYVVAGQHFDSTQAIDWGLGCSRYQPRSASPIWLPKLRRWYEITKMYISYYSAVQK